MTDMVDYNNWSAFNMLNKPNMPQIPFIKKIVPTIIRTSDRGILNSIRMAQAILESGWGTSELARNANNLFGIKADSRWKGRVYNIVTNEWSKEKDNYKITANFRLYDDVSECIKDHVQFIQAPRYKAIIGDMSYESVAHKLREAGYATDPKYPSKLINVIRKNSLMWFDIFTVLAGVNKLLDIPTFKVGDIVRVKPNSTWMTNPPKLVPGWAYNRVFTIDELDGNRAILNKNGINSPINISNLTLVTN